MGKFGTIALVFLILVLTHCGNKDRKPGPDSRSQKSDTGKAILIFKEYEHDFGKVTEGEKVGYVFKFENSGTGDLVILSATTSCGCTVPEYDTKPIARGESGNLDVVFDTSGRNGMQTKTITVKSNASTPIIILKITAEVIPVAKK